MKLGILANGHPSQESQKQGNFDFLHQTNESAPSFFQKIALQVKRVKPFVFV